MRRALIGFAAVAAIVVVAIVATRGGDSGSRYRVAVVFDTAKGMVTGQQVKIAGAPAGTVKEIDLAPGPKARMVLDVDERFAPFHADASCSILPEGLISENYVECDPGSSRAPLPGGAAGGTPTVRLAHTTVPVSLQDVLDVFSLPTDQRLRILVSQLGIGLSGRGQDLDALLRRANPALRASDDALRIFAQQRTQIGAAIADTDRVLRRLGDQRGQVRAFVDRAAATVRTTAAHRADLGRAVQKLPAMLDAVRPGLRSLDRAATNATPLVTALGRSGPGLARLTRTLPAFARAGMPALAALGSVTKQAQPVVRRAQPTVARLQRATQQLGPLTPDIDRLLVSLRDTGGIEGTMRLLYTLAALTSTYDKTSHLINFIANVGPNCLIAEEAHTDSPGCSDKWSAPGQGTIPINEPSCGPQKPTDLWRNHRCPLATPLGTFPDLGALAPAKGSKRAKAKRPAKAAAPARPAPAPSRPAQGDAPKQPGLDLPGTLNRILGNLPGATGGGGRAGGDGGGSPKQLTGLLDYLLK